LNQDSSYKITGEKRQGMSNFLQSQKLALLPFTLAANEGKAFTCCRRTRKTKTEDRKVDIMPVLADAGWGLEPIMPIEKKCYSYPSRGHSDKNSVC